MARLLNINNSEIANCDLTVKGHNEYGSTEYTYDTLSALLSDWTDAEGSKPEKEFKEGDPVWYTHIDGSCEKAFIEDILPNGDYLITIDNGLFFSDETVVCTERRLLPRKAKKRFFWF